MFCGNCGSSLQDGAKFCDSCGAKVEAAAPVNETQPEATPEVSGQPRDTADNTTQSMPVKEVQSSSHTSYTPPAQPASGYVAPQPDQGYSGQQHTYQPAASQPYGPFVDNSPLSVGQYIVMFILMAIPLVNLIMLFVWGFSSSENTNKKNFARASLILLVIAIGLWIIVAIFIVGVVGSMVGSYY